MTADRDRLAPISPDAFGSVSARKAFSGHEFGKLWNVDDCCIFDTGCLARSFFLVFRYDRDSQTTALDGTHEVANSINLVSDHVCDLKTRDLVLNSNQQFEPIKPIRPEILLKARIVRQVVGIDSEMPSYDFANLDDEIVLHGPAACLKARTRITVSQLLQEKLGSTTDRELKLLYVRYPTLVARLR
jgi:hypothetical protein